MHIYCPKCNAGYEIDEQLIKDRSRQVKCSNCGEIFVADRLLFESADNELKNKIEGEEAFEMLHDAMAEEDDKNQKNYEQEIDHLSEKKQDNIVDENKTDDIVGVSEEVSVKEENSDDIEDENIDLESIFERLSEHTEHLMEQEKKLPIYAKIWLQIKNILGFHFKIRWGYIIAFVAVFVVLSLFNNRYQIVREMPFLNPLYKAFGINAKIPGEGLEFQNIGWEFFDDEGMRLEIKGFVFNTTEKNVELPLVHIELLDKNTVLLQSLNREIDETMVEANAKIPLDVVVENPAPTAKYVYLTFIEKD